MCHNVRKGLRCLLSRQHEHVGWEAGELKLFLRLAIWFEWCIHSNVDSFRMVAQVMGCGRAVVDMLSSIQDDIIDDPGRTVGYA